MAHDGDKNCDNFGSSRGIHRILSISDIDIPTFQVGRWIGTSFFHEIRNSLAISTTPVCSFCNSGLPMATVTYEPNAGALTLDPRENSDPVTEGFRIVSTFAGNGWTELEAFIRSIRAIAWNEGKLQDPLWMANYASLHFSGKALRWHAELPEDIQESWRKLEVAMVARWPPPDDSEDDVRSVFPCRIRPNFRRELKADYIIVRAPIAAAASPGNVFSAVFGSRPALVVVKLLLKESDKWFFLGKPESG